MITEHFKENGFAVISQTISHQLIDGLLSKYLGLVNKVSGRKFSNPFGEDLVEFFNNHEQTESLVYNKIRESSWLEEFSLQEALYEPILQILNEPFALLKKIPFRIDMPHWTEEIAHWHQDHFYVKGNTNIVTAWIPLQDTSFLNGCLSIMPKSHNLGILEHDLKLGKKNVPSNIFTNAIRMVEMKKGDLLLFHSLLLHSGNLNFSNSIRYSIQPRFTRISETVDESMGGLIPINKLQEDLK